MLSLTDPVAYYHFFVMGLPDRHGRRVPELRRDHPGFTKSPPPKTLASIPTLGRLER